MAPRVCNGPGRHQLITYIGHRAWAVDPEGLVHQIPVLTPEYLPLAQLVPVIAPTYSLSWRAEKVFTVRQSIAQNLSDL